MPPHVAHVLLELSPFHALAFVVRIRDYQPAGHSRTRAARAATKSWGRAVTEFRPDRRRGIGLMLMAGLCWSLGGVIVRMLVVQNTWEIVFWRSLFMAVFVVTILVSLHGRGTLDEIRAVGASGVISAICLAAQIHFFILALRHTSTANTFVLMSISPLVTAIVGRLFMREQIAWHTWLAIAVALTGIAVMFGQDFAVGAAGGQWLGNLFALGVPLAYACQILSARRVRGTVGTRAPNLMPTILIAGIIAAVPAFGWMPAISANARDIGLLALMGGLQLGLGCWLMTLAVRHLRAAEMGLLALVETILAPLWVWLVVGEIPGTAALIGGALIVGALIANGALALRRPSDA